MTAEQLIESEKKSVCCILSDLRDKMTTADYIADHEFTKDEVESIRKAAEALTKELRKAYRRLDF